MCSLYYLFEYCLKKEWKTIRACTISEISLLSLGFKSHWQWKEATETMKNTEWLCKLTIAFTAFLAWGIHVIQNEVNDWRSLPSGNYIGSTWYMVMVLVCLLWTCSCYELLRGSTSQQTRRAEKTTDQQLTPRSGVGNIGWRQWWVLSQNCAVLLLWQACSSDSWAWTCHSITFPEHYIHFKVSFYLFYFFK